MKKYGLLLSLLPSVALSQGLVKEFRHEVYSHFGIKKEKWDVDFGKQLKLTGSNVQVGYRANFKLTDSIGLLAGTGVLRLELEDNTKHTYMQNSRVEDIQGFLEAGVFYEVTDRLRISLQPRVTKRLIFGQLKCTREECRKNNVHSYGFDSNDRMGLAMTVSYEFPVGLFVLSELEAYKGYWNHAVSTKDKDKKIIGASLALGLGVRF